MSLHTNVIILQATSLITVMKSLGESIVHHIKYYVQLGQDDGKEKNVKPSKHTLPIHRMTVINLATFLVQFLESLVPLEMVRIVIYCCSYHLKNDSLKSEKDIQISWISFLV